MVIAVPRLTPAQTKNDQVTPCAKSIRTWVGAGCEPAANPAVKISASMAKPIAIASHATITTRLSASLAP
ncbi:hypothetical protein X744_00235 [Mesorhizobium sp. LNJC372A00]|nr:hypothetical protein X750_07010 [Mesorhizobium sp. LNJC394B00]ESY52699.1 hypothetical protein X745_20325 [Mesorhizobium sp. LNJC374B00]ESY62107.1 hypothetical protein X744_00235 [Mesorhizobium sp. LNJC372A00]